MDELKTTPETRAAMREYITEMVEADSGWSDQNRDQGFLLDDVEDLERQLTKANHNWQTIVNLQAITIALREQQLAEANDHYVLLTDELWHIFGEQDRRDYAVQAKEIIAKLTKAHKATSWISVDERQPTMPFQNANGKYSQDVLVLLDNDLMRVCYYHDYRWELAGLDKVQVENVLYWQELSIPATVEVN